jgi:hypothetical protein
MSDTGGKPLGVQIDFADNGWKVVVGCKEFVFGRIDLPKLVNLLQEYLESPVRARERYEKGDFEILREG